MKTHVCLMLAVVFAVGVQAQGFHDWKVDFKITDESGQPVKEAQATVFYDPMAQPDKSIDPGKITGLTDSNGVFAASHHDRTYGLRFLVEKDGYYSTDIQDDFHRVFSPENLNQNLNLNLKKVGKPIAMYAKFNTPGLKVPEYGKPIAYDLEIGDWVDDYVPREHDPAGFCDRLGGVTRKKTQKEKMFWSGSGCRTAKFAGCPSRPA
jgi:hypothetical protein